MAFCPHCGKQVTEQASKCIHCGNELDPKAKAARFKGTMMMTPATGPMVASPAAGADAGAKAPEAPPKPAAAPPAAAAAAPAPRAPTPGPSKVMKATMLGTGGAGLAPPMAKPRAVTTPNAPAQVAPPPAARVVTMPNAPGQVASPPAVRAVTAPNAQKPAAPAVGAPQSAPQEAATIDPAVEKPSAPVRTDGPFADEATDPEDSQRFLVGDPMAPAQPAARVTGRGARESGDDQLPLQNTGRLLALGAAGLFVIALVGYLAARFMGLIN